MTTRQREYRELDRCVREEEAARERYDLDRTPETRREFRNAQRNTNHQRAVIDSLPALREDSGEEDA